jgi:hypothetical protein
LYRFEDVPMIPNRITVHTTAKGEGGKMEDHVIAAIAERYKNFDIIQIGGKRDKKTPFENKLGLDFWKTAEIIASSSIYIGVNSGMMHVASCYPRINRKIIINKKDIHWWKPMCNDEVWIDHNCQYYNQFANDVGVTYSYKKI